MKLFEFNETLPEDKKLFFVGIDVQHNQDTGIDYVISLFDGKKTAPQPVAAALTALQSHSEKGVQEASRLLDENQKDFEGYFGEIPNLASYMNNEHSPTEGKVCSIMTNYIDCFYMDTQSGGRIPVTYSHSESLSRLLNQAAEADLVLFPLGREGSPFVESGFTEAFQYSLCVKNSPAATPYGELGQRK